jgi:autotransporter-associated beta strand protein
LSLVGAGTATLNAANTYSGGTVLAAGLLNLGHDSGLGSGTLTFAGGSLDAVAGSRTLTGNNSIQVTGDFAFVGTNSLNLGTGMVTIPSVKILTVTAGEDVTKGGLNFFNDQFELTRLVEKPSAEQVEQLRADGWLKPGQPAWYNAGIYLFKPSLFDFTSRLVKSPRGEYELTDAISAIIDAGHRIAGLQIEGRWVDVRDPEVLASLQS